MSLALRRYCLYPIMLTKVDGVPSERAFQITLAFSLANHISWMTWCYRHVSNKR